MFNKIYVYMPLQPLRRAYCGPLLALVTDVAQRFASGM